MGRDFRESPQFTWGMRAPYEGNPSIARASVARPRHDTLDTSVPSGVAERDVTRAPEATRGRPSGGYAG